ncbi:hypothetical protein [Brevibacillus sp. 179-C9.3 HS]|uniref:hypothetical protein n=1 Tax=unclassified Brevibacillus TaxID=2684853 RepID=UPI0039A0C3A7
MGQIKEDKKKMTKIMAQLKKIDGDFGEREIDFLKDIEIALNLPKKKDRRRKISRLNDELNGYATRIFDTLTKASKIYAAETKVKDLKKLAELIDSSKRIEKANEILSEMREYRHKSAHPDAYYSNKKILYQADNIHDAIKSFNEGLRSLELVDEISLRREEESQNDFIEKAFRDFYNEKKSLNTEEKKGGILRISLRPQ